MFAASQVAKQANGRIRVCHVPKTIDNDLPLPGEIPTFGFETARQLGSELVQNIMEDSRTTQRWYFVVVMGRTAGHLALGIGKATGATLTLVPEEFPGPIRMATVCDILEGAILKRRALWNRPDGVAIIAEGLLEHMVPRPVRPRSFHRDALREVARLVHITAAQHRQVIGPELERRGYEERLGPIG